MVGPFEVESALMEHPAVAEAGVIGKPDPLIGEVVKAFVALKPGREPSDELRLELLGFGRKKLGSSLSAAAGDASSAARIPTVAYRSPLMLCRRMFIDDPGSFRAFRTASRCPIAAPCCSSRRS
jgi:acyl-CoA synthetase (AMP-forming)/AMP-acid ligase II